jgi:glucose-6-phosphate isomerase
MTATSEAKLTNRQSWKALGTHYESIRNVHLRTLFEDDPKRGERFTLEAAGLFLDYSKTESRTKPLRSSANWRGSAASARESKQCSAATK